MDKRISELINLINEDETCHEQDGKVVLLKANLSHSFTSFVMELIYVYYEGVFSNEAQDIITQWLEAVLDEGAMYRDLCR